jgi:hypothetical protein
MICPIMSRNVAESFDNENPTIMRIDFQKTMCVGKDCALWVVEIPNGVLSEGQKPIEHCGLVK